MKVSQAFKALWSKVQIKPRISQEMQTTQAGGNLPRSTKMSQDKVLGTDEAKFNLYQSGRLKVWRNFCSSSQTFTKSGGGSVTAWASSETDSFVFSDDVRQHGLRRLQKHFQCQFKDMCFWRAVWVLLGSRFHMKHIKCLSHIFVVYIVLHKPFVVLMK